MHSGASLTIVGAGIGTRERTARESRRHAGQDPGNGLALEFSQAAAKYSDEPQKCDRRERDEI